jgi:hypothetical protein
MTGSKLYRALIQTISDLRRQRASFALVGGLAVSARTQPRFTRDVDLAVSVAADADAERLVHVLSQASYEVEAIVEHERTGRLATARLATPEGSGVVIDLLFASSGIEPEIVSAATPLRLAPEIEMPVAALHHLIATKVLARDDVRRPQDAMDLANLLPEASAEDRRGVVEALRLIEARGFSRGRDLEAAWAKLLAAYPLSSV